MSERLVADRLDVADVLFRFARAFDEGDWHAMRACLADVLQCDYSSFRGTPPGPVAADVYVADRRGALTGLRTVHNLTNLEIAVDDDRAHVRCNYVILRFASALVGSDRDVFHSAGRYDFALARTAGAWRITAITQIVVASQGNPELHGAVRRPAGG